ncbi:MAG: geranylgeranyl reductase family protein [Acidimicrobiia bacterium]
MNDKNQSLYPSEVSLPLEKSLDFDVVVIGGGPSGASCAYWLATNGYSVALVEKKKFPREKTCGDGLTPRAVYQLHNMGLKEQITQFHKYDGLRSIAFGRTLEMPWPDHDYLPNYGFVAKRSEIDSLVVKNAQNAGVQLFLGFEAKEPEFDSLTGAIKSVYIEYKNGERYELNAKYVAVCEGSTPRFGRHVGLVRNKTFPMGMAIRGYYKSPMHNDPWIESHLDIVDKNGDFMPGYGWIFPVGDGTINVGVGLLSTFKGYKNINTSRLMESFCEIAPSYWEIKDENSCGAPTGGKLPTGGCTGPKVGTNWVVAGDSAGLINPFNGEGIAYGYETGFMAANAITLALKNENNELLNTYTDELSKEFGKYFAVARHFVKYIGNPRVMRECVRVGMHSKPLMEMLLKIMANLMNSKNKGIAELAYRSVSSMVSKEKNLIK